MVSRRHLLFGLAGLPAARTLAFQEPQEDDARFSTGISVVNILAAVRDRDGRIVKGLSIDDFILEENGQPVPIRYFSQQTDLPLIVGLVVDCSGSVRGVLNDEKKAARNFLRQVIRPDKDRAFVMRFAQEIELMEDLTSSLKLLEQAVEDIDGMTPGLTVPRRFQSPFQFPGQTRPRFPSPIPIPGRLPPQRPTPSPVPSGRPRLGGTCLHDAIFLGADEIMRPQTGRKAMILISDGLDEGSKVSLSTAIEAAQRADSLVYSIRFGSDNERGRQIGIPVLERYAEETGGTFFDPDNKRLDKVFASIEEELRNQYSLGFTPDTVGTGYRRIRVTCKRPGLKVRTRDGYYAS